jgi:F-type H+-transporting ATPase subunit b
MLDLDSTIFIQFINFCVTFLVLNWLLISPVRGIIKKRNEKMASLLEGAEGFTARAEEKLKSYGAALDEARRLGSEERSAIKESGVTEEHQLISAANAGAAKELAQVKQDLDKQADAARQELKGKVQAMAQQVTAKVLD